MVLVSMSLSSHGVMGACKVVGEVRVWLGRSCLQAVAVVVSVSMNVSGHGVVGAVVVMVTLLLCMLLCCIQCLSCKLSACPAQHTLCIPPSAQHSIAQHSMQQSEPCVLLTRCGYPTRAPL